MNSFGDKMSQTILINEDDLHAIIRKTNRIDLIIDQYKEKIPFGVWMILNDLNSERCEVFEKYCKNWDELD